MDQSTRHAALAAAFVSIALAGCGGGNSSTSTSAAPSPSAGASGPTAQAIQGVTTPNSVSVVTAKNTN